MKAIVTGALIALAITMARAQEDRSIPANDVFLGCKAALRERSDWGVEAKSAYCTIVVAGLLETAEHERRSGERKLCANIPNGVTIDQGLRVAVRYIEARPQRMHEPFYALAAEALHDAWPCQKEP